MKKNDRYFYPAVFTYELGCVLFGLEEDGEEIPQPTSLIDVPVKSNEQVVLIDAFLSSVRLAQSN